MNRSHRDSPVHARAFGVILLAATTLAACDSMPKHTNTMVFGTSTKVALDVSQDPSGTVGITIGYKRQEAVWMPLMPNAAASAPGGSGPAACTKDGKCPKFAGTQRGENDTYSVLATFGGTVDAGADAQARTGKAGARIAQFFATGFAARALAERGGAALVNTQADVVALSPEELAAAQARAKRFNSEFDDLAARVQAADGKAVDKTKLDAAFAADPGKKIAEPIKADILAATTVEQLRDAVTSYPKVEVLAPMLETLRAKKN